MKIPKYFEDWFYSFGLLDEIFIASMMLYVQKE